MTLSAATGKMREPLLIRNRPVSRWYVLVKHMPLCCTAQCIQHVCYCGCSSRPRSSRAPHNPFLCCSLLVTCKDSVSAALRELSAVLHKITAAACCICCSRILMQYRRPRLHGAHEMNISAAESAAFMSLLQTFPSVACCICTFPWE